MGSSIKNGAVDDVDGVVDWTVLPVTDDATFDDRCLRAVLVFLFLTPVFVDKEVDDRPVVYMAGDDKDVALFLLSL